MKHLFAVVLLSCTLLGCSSYDSYRITQTKRLKQDTHDGIKRALDGKLTKIEYESILQSYDTVMIEEQAKKGEGLEELTEENDADSKKMAEELFGGE